MSDIHAYKRSHQLSHIATTICPSSQNTTTLLLSNQSTPPGSLDSQSINSTSFDGTNSPYSMSENILGSARNLGVPFITSSAGSCISLWVPPCACTWQPQNLTLSLQTPPHPPSLPWQSTLLPYSLLVSFFAILSRLGQLQNYLQNIQRLVSDGTWLQQLGEEHCALVKSLSWILKCRDNSEVKLNVTQRQNQVVFRGESETLVEDQRGVEF